MLYLVVDESNECYANGCYVSAVGGYTPIRMKARLFTLSGALDYLIWIGRENWYRYALLPVERVRAVLSPAATETK